jgi:hypothetical protein
MSFDYAALAAAGFNVVKVEYSGSGDEGWINDIVSVDPELPEGMAFPGGLYEKVERTAYEVLEANFGGWEINEGSYGVITIHVAEKRTTLDHSWYVETVEHEEKEIR